MKNIMIKARHVFLVITIDGKPVVAKQYNVHFPNAPPGLSKEDL